MFKKEEEENEIIKQIKSSYEFLKKGVVVFFKKKVFYV